MTAQAEQANNNASHKGNGDKENHFEEAHKKTARDFYVKVEGKTRDEARKIVDGLVARGLLKDISFYVKAIKNEAVRQENIAKREQAQKEQREREAREEQARREEFARREAEKEKAKAAAEIEAAAAAVAWPARAEAKELEWALQAEKAAKLAA